MEVIAVDPATASVEVARRKPDADRVRWLVGDATTLPPLQLDLATMTGNVAQAIIDPKAWRESLRGIHDALRPGGYLAFETRDPAFRGWEEWTRSQTHRITDVAGVGRVESWIELMEVSLPLVRF